MQQLICTLSLFLILIGCKSAQPSDLDKCVAEYNQGQWLLSEMWAKKSIDANKNVGESQYMMGLCEFKREHVEEATLWFSKAAASSNQEVQGKANAMLGIISENEDDYATATIAFRKAERDLTGIDKQKASKKFSNFDSSSIGASDAFTLQFGAYKDESNATTAVATLTPTLAKAGIDSVWITENTDFSGRTLYLVRAGHFASRRAATNRKNHGDLPHCIVTAAE